MDRSTFLKLFGIKTIARHNQFYVDKAPLVILRENIAGIPFYFANDKDDGTEIIHVHPIATSPINGASISDHLRNHMADNTLRLASVADCEKFRIHPESHILSA